MTIETLRIENVEQCQESQIQKLIIEFMGTNRLVKDPIAAGLELCMRIQHPDVGFFLAREDDEDWTGAILIQRSRTQLNPGCTVLHLMNNGGDEVRNALLEELLEYAREGGFEDIIAIDTNNKPQGFAKLFQVAGTPTKLGAVFHFDINESLL